MRYFLALLAILIWPVAAEAVPQSSGTVVSVCGTVSPPFVVNRDGPITLDTNGQLCISGTITATNPSVSTTGAAVPASGTYFAGNKSGNLVGVTLDGSSNLNVNCTVGCAGGTASNATSGVATSADNGKTIAWLFGFNGTTWDQLQVDASKFLKVILQTGSTTAVTQATAANLNAAVVGVGTAGTASGGVLTVQGAASMTKLLVTPDSVALPANQSVNVAQINGVTPLMGNGVTGTGSPRVTIASDNTPFHSIIDSGSKTQIVDGSGNVIASTSNNLNVQCANCSGSGASAADEASFTAGASTFAPSGGFFQTTATSNPLTTGQQGLVQMTAQRAFFTNLRNAAGAEAGVAAVPLQVSLANTGANGTSIAVTATSSGNFAITAASGSIASGAVASGAVASGAFASGSIGSGAIASGAVASGAYASGSVSDGAIVTLGAKADAKSAATDTTAITIMQVLKEISAMAQAPAALPANQSTNVAQINGVTPLMGNGVTGTGSQRVTVASDNTPFHTIIDSGSTTAVTGTVTASATLQTQTDTVMVGGVNVKEINAVTPLMGNGVTGTGSQRVTIASDNTAFSVNGTLQTQTDTVMVGGVNVKEINGVTPLMGNGVTGTGSLRVTLASDTTANSNPFLVTVVPSATAGGTTLFTVTLAAGTNATNVKASAGQLYSISGFNMSSATPVWISLYNNSGTPTCGTAIIQQFLIPGSTTGTGFVYDFADPKAFSSGIAFCATTGIAGTGNPAATTYVLNIDYK